MSIVARAAVLKQASLRAAAVPRIPTNAVMQRRAAHYENTVYNNFPFKYDNKRKFAIKCVVFFTTGFSIPFLAAGYQLKKAGGGV